MKIRTSEILAATKVLCEHVEACGCEEIEITVNSYWEIPREQEYDTYDKPHEFMLGDLEDDWDEVIKMIKNPDEAVAYGFMWLASVLRAIGQDTPCP